MKSLLKLGYEEKYEVIALVGDKELFNEFADKVKLIEFSKSKRNWLFRLYYEYIYFYFFSRRENVDVWISLHDITPNVSAKKLYVYCHNPSPFNEMRIADAKYGLKYYLFSKFYKYLYAINIHKADGVIVQQDWMRKKFKSMYNLNNVIVSRPDLPSPVIKSSGKKSNNCIFVYPSYPRYYKNFESVCEAAVKLNDEGIKNFRIYLTVNGSENNYSKMLVEKYGRYDEIIFCGLLSRNKLYELYAQSDGLIFMSKLETWGMPITEFKPTKKAMIVADLPYAHETVGKYDDVSFVAPNNINSISDSMMKIIEGKSLNKVSDLNDPVDPFYDGWTDLIKGIL